MKFTAQEEFGLRCLLQIARMSPTGGATIPELGRVEGISQAHVGKLTAALRKSGFIASTRGQVGGYTLARPANEIVLADVLASLGGKLYDGGFCDRHKGQVTICTHAVDCSVRSLWQALQSTVDAVLERLTLADLLQPAAQTVHLHSDPSSRPVASATTQA